jgi:chromosomal replication initiator protein
MYKGKPETLPTAPLIISEVAKYYGIDESVIRSKLKNKGTAEARTMAIYLTRDLTGLSLPEIGREFDRDHSTILYSIRKIEQLVKSGDAATQATIRDITANINNRL